MIHKRSSTSVTHAVSNIMVDRSPAESLKLPKLISKDRFIDTKKQNDLMGMERPKSHLGKINRNKTNFSITFHPN